MTQNRIIPYGYKRENGRNVIHDDEAKVVRCIYRTYAKGLSYKTIAENLTAEGNRYKPDKPIWNKNMVARILQNPIYLGMDKYPMIVEEALCKMVKMAQKPYTHTEPQEIKAIKPLLVCAVCGKPIHRRLKTCGVERWYCEENFKHISVSVTDEILLKSFEDLWRHLKDNPELADVGVKASEGNQISLETNRQTNEIEQKLKAEEINDNELQSNILELASLRYASCDTPRNNNRGLMQRLQQAPQGFNIKLILEIAEEIKVSYCEAEALVLKNGKVIAKGERP